MKTYPHNQRRDFLKQMGLGAAAVGLFGAGSVLANTARSGSGGRVVVVGGGFGGATAAKYIRMLDPRIEVVLIEQNRQYVSCPFSNLYLGGLLPNLDSLTLGYDRLVANHGIAVVHDKVTAVDPVRRTISVAGATMTYDRLVLSPGIDFRTAEIEGYNPETTPLVMPHAWKAGPQTVLLRRQLQDMPDGGTVVMSVPLAPFRCPAGPYERASMIAMYLKQHKPRAKLIVLDANPDIVSKAGLFKRGWAKHYAGIIQYRGAQKVTEVNPQSRSVLIEGIEEVKGDVVNVVPPQRAGAIAAQTGLIGPDRNWCPIHPDTFESTLHANIHVIGDACIAGAMPKSGHSANSEAKACAANIVALMNGRETIGFSGINTCYSYVTATEAISVAGVYRAERGGIVAVPQSGGVSTDLSEAEAFYARGWFNNMLSEMSH